MPEKNLFWFIKEPFSEI